MDDVRTETINIPYRANGGSRQETTSDVRCVRAFGNLRRYARKSTCTSLRSPSDHGQTPKKKKKGGGVRRMWVNALSSSLETSESVSVPPGPSPSPNWDPHRDHYET